MDRLFYRRVNQHAVCGPAQSTDQDYKPWIASDRGNCGHASHAPTAAFALGIRCNFHKSTSGIDRAVRLMPECTPTPKSTASPALSEPRSIWCPSRSWHPISQASDVAAAAYNCWPACPVTYVTAGNLFCPHDRWEQTPAQGRPCGERTRL